MTMITHTSTGSIYCQDCGRGPLWQTFDLGWGPICLACYNKAHADDKLAEDSQKDETEPQGSGAVEAMINIYGGD